MHQEAMVFSLLILLIFILNNDIATADSTTEYVQQLEQKLRESEQKQAAVLASVLSKLQAQEEKIHELEDKLENITDSNSTTDGLQVAFEAMSTTEMKSSRVYFKKEILNVGGGYDAERGSFVAPRMGIYQFWFSVFVSARPQQFASRLSMIDLKAGSSLLGGQVSPVPVQISMYPGSQSLVTRLVQGLHIVPLTHGDTVSVEHKSHGSVTQGSVFSGILLQSLLKIIFKGSLKQCYSVISLAQKCFLVEWCKFFLNLE